MTQLITEVHTASHGTYGARRVHAELTLGHGIAVGHGCVEMLMRAAGVKGLPGNKRARSKHHTPTASDLVDRKFTRDEPDKLWVTDITEHPTPWIPAIVATPTERCCNGWQKVHGSAEGRILPITRQRWHGPRRSACSRRS
ncbi:IS3 family transposase [Rhodococcus erythropolis]|nr:IS3 family transposase [Rhodococcus erythropolis]